MTSTRRRRTASSGGPRKIGAQWKLYQLASALSRPAPGESRKSHAWHSPSSAWNMRTSVAGKQCAWSDSNQRSEEHTSELQSLMRISYAVVCLKKNNSHIHPRLNKINTTSNLTTPTHR